ncbi:MAG: NADH-quinone oxidoreductase subunit N [Bacteroidota bacterium]|nr:NADH-quinone oxidoreductase subunit N [Candidatus Kapabacteria bacterium]MDW8220482.1 NADH-quinone oxidoreductase subunit N [Bacteroidota bacterium]
MLYDIVVSLPIVLCSFFGITAMILGALIPKRRSNIVMPYAAVGLGIVFIFASLLWAKNGTAFNGMIQTGMYPSFFDMVFTVAGILVMLAARPYLQRMNWERDEFYVLIVFAVSGMMLMAHSQHLLITFIGIEVMSISFYALAAYVRHESLAVEAGLKYFLMGAFSTGFLLYGIALVYGATGGKLEYSSIQVAVGYGSQMPFLLLAGTGLIIIGLCFKVAAFPFHVWAPDVYQGAPTIVTALMSTAGKAAAFAAFIPLATALIPNGGPDSVRITYLLAAISAASMLYGNIAACAQHNVKRMLAYSSIAQAGYMMIGIVAGTERGTSGLMFYTAAYLFTQMGALIIASTLENRYANHVEFSDYAGLSRRHPLLAALMALFMFSLVGLPPFAVFFGKYYLFTAAIEAGYTWLALTGVLASVISAYFYLGLVVAMYFRRHETGDVHPAQPGISGVTIAFATLGVLLLGLIPAALLRITGVGL